MTAFENIVMGKSSIPALILTIVLTIAMTVLFLVCWRGKHKEQTSMRYLIAGAAGFLVSARVLELGVHYFCILADNPVSRFISGSTVAYVLYGTVMAGVFEECGRHIVLKSILKKNRTRANAVLFSKGTVEEALTALKITEDTAAAALPSVQAAAAFDYGMMAMNVIERLLAMLLHIGLTVIVFYGVVSARKGYLPLAILLHMLMDLFAALYQRGAVPLWSVEVWAACWTAVTGFVAVRLYRKMKERTW